MREVIDSTGSADRGRWSSGCWRWEPLARLWPLSRSVAIRTEVFRGRRAQDAGASLHFCLGLKDEGPVQARPVACEVKV